MAVIPLQMNASRPPFKMGSFDHFLNRQITIILVVQVGGRGAEQLVGSMRGMQRAILARACEGCMLLLHGPRERNLSAVKVSHTKIPERGSSTCRARMHACMQVGTHMHVRAVCGS